MQTRERELYHLARRMTWTVRANAVASVAFGLMLLFWPGPTLLVAAVLLGLWLLLYGATKLVEAFGTGPVTPMVRAARLLAGLLFLAAGIWTIRRPTTSLEVLAVLVGACLIVGGAVELVMAVFERQRRGWLRGLLGAVAIVAGIVTFSWPAATVAVFTTVAGIALAVLGAVQFFLARNAGAALRGLAE
jgi:uncharacterized membrane protein HdeD (DUF308 family)